MSINVARRHFRSGGVFYPAGTVIKDLAGIRLYKSKVREGKIAVVDEHNLDQVSLYILHKTGFDAKESLKEALSKVPADKYNNDPGDNDPGDNDPGDNDPGDNDPGVDEEYLVKVRAAAKYYGIDMEGREISEVVAEIKTKASK